jgi:hypothetical protein
MGYIMKKEIKQLWIDALESGKYKQGRRALRKGNNFCCLGVLCDLYNKETGGLNSYWDGNNFLIGEGDGFAYDATLPMDVAHWAGLHDDDPEVDGNTLSTHNDGTDELFHVIIAPKNFKEIAALIRKHL